GYAMNKSLGELTLFDVYKAIDPDLFIIECMASGYECPTDGKGDHLPCYMHRELCEIQQGVWEMLKRKSLQEVLMPEM
ncbi:MAG: Rrf2 family transcriptional regulator, partial [Blautia faecis]|nr:Rrf2 family transcriptional regulator [Blautia faecis]